MTREVPNDQASDQDVGLSYRVRNERTRPADPGPRLARVLRAIGNFILLAGLVLGVPLGVFGGLIGVADSVGVSILAGVTFGLVVFAVPPILVGVILLQASRVVRRRDRRPRPSP